MSSEEDSGEHTPLLSSMVLDSPNTPQVALPGERRRGKFIFNIFNKWHLFIINVNLIM